MQIQSDAGHASYNRCVVKQQPRQTLFYTFSTNINLWRPIQREITRVRSMFNRNAGETRVRRTLPTWRWRKPPINHIQTMN